LKFFTDILQTDDKWSLSRVMLVIMFFLILLSWLLGIAPLISQITTIFGLLLGYVFGDKIQKNIENITKRRLEVEESLMIEE